MPSVSIGIPTYRRPEHLRRAVASALAQDHQDIEVLISDNGSGDETDEIGRAFAAADPRVRYLHHDENRGPTFNFLAVLGAATGEYFMWLGDDDWIDPGYVTACLHAVAAPGVALAAGVAREYHDNTWTGDHRPVPILDEDPAARVAHYFWTVQQNSQFYGLLRRDLLLDCQLANTLAGDWLLMAQVAFRGKMVIVPEVRIHRERAVRTSRSVASIVRTFGLPRVHEMLPAASIITAAMGDILRSDVYAQLPMHERITLAARVSAILTARVGIWAPIRRTLSPLIGVERARRWKAAVLAPFRRRRG